MQKRLTRKLDLEILLSNVKPHPTPSPTLEQYTVPTDVAAQMLYIAAYTYDDIIGKTVLDLGCGTGRLALGAAFLGAKQVVGVDIDKTAVKAASENSANTRLKNKVQWVAGDIDTVCGNFDTVLQNPPFGVQTRGADRRFIEKALKSGKTIYSLHKSAQANTTPTRRRKRHKNVMAQVPPSDFLTSFIKKNSGNIKAIYPMAMTIPHMFKFHTKKKHGFTVNLYVVERERHNKTSTTGN